MDKYLTIFSEQLEKEFNPESLFPVNEIHIRGRLKRLFLAGKQEEKRRAGGQPGVETENTRKRVMAKMN